MNAPTIKPPQHRIVPFALHHLAPCVDIIKEAIGEDDARQASVHLHEYLALVHHPQQRKPTSPHEALWVAQLNGVPVGICGLYGISPKELLSGSGEAQVICGLHWFAVHPLIQRQGIGSDLLRMTEDVAKLSRFCIIFTQADARAVDWYTRKGYHLAGNRLANPMPHTTYMEKSL